MTYSYGIYVTAFLLSLNTMSDLCKTLTKLTQLRNNGVPRRAYFNKPKPKSQRSSHMPRVQIQGVKVQVPGLLYSHV